MDRFRIAYVLAALLAGCAAPGIGNNSSPAPVTGTPANNATDRAAHQEVTYANASRPGPQIVVLPGEVKSSHSLGLGPNNIADMAELELTRANFKVLERSNLSQLMSEFEIAYNQGNPQVARQVLQKGKMQATRWVLRFDILKAEPIAQASSGIDAAAIGSIFSTLVGGKAGSVGSTVGQSTQVGEASKVWLVGMRYKIIDANTTEQVATGYVEDKMEVGSSATTIAGISRSVTSGVGLDTLAQRLVQKSVAEIDARHK
jgi:curli biogenesis system outer membrane secretion channel CsgG